jgi:hypothetical protein
VAKCRVLDSLHEAVPDLTRVREVAMIDLKKSVRSSDLGPLCRRVSRAIDRWHSCSGARRRMARLRRTAYDAAIAALREAGLTVVDLASILSAGNARSPASRRASSPAPCARPKLRPLADNPVPLQLGAAHHHTVHPRQGQPRAIVCIVRPLKSLRFQEPAIVMFPGTLRWLSADSLAHRSAC